MSRACLPFRPRRPTSAWADASALELLGTFGLVLGGCGSAVLAAKFLTDDSVQLGIGFVGVALAFGLTVLTGAFAFGHVSGGHFNPAVTVWLAVARRFGWRGAHSPGHYGLGAALLRVTYGRITGAGPGPEPSTGVADNPT